MPTVDASNVTQTFSYNAPGAADFASYDSHSFTTYSWLSTDGHLITVTGSGITVDGSNIPTAGTFTSVTIDLGDDDNANPEITITGLPPIALTDLTFAAGSASNDAFWSNILAGETTFIDSATNIATFGGDFNTLITAGFFEADDDIFNGSGINNSEVYGDAANVQDATLVAGDDIFTGTFDFWYADVLNLSGSATVFGGDDTITATPDFTAEGSSGANLFIYGDASGVSGTAILIGGDDIIDGRAQVSPSLEIRGDANVISGSGLVQGGNDLIYGGEQGDIIWGDALDVASATATLIGGDDEIYGGDGDDNIYGDYQSANAGANVVGGDDRLYGEDGDDFLFGNEGDDLLNGGEGADALDGGEGSDTADYTTSADGVTVDLSNDANNTGGDAAGDTFTDIENITGSTRSDTLTGDANANVINGQGSRDVIHGGGGADTLLGGGSADTFTFDGGDVVAGEVIDGGSAIDTLSLTAGNVTFSSAELISIEAISFEGRAEGGTFVANFLANQIGNGGLALDSEIIGDTATTGSSAFQITLGEETSLDISGFTFSDWTGTTEINGSFSGDVGQINGSANNDTIIGSDSAEFIFGSGGTDNLSGSGGNDYIQSNVGDDTLDGGSGNDTLIGLEGGDTYIGGSGFDTVLYFSAVDLRLDGGTSTGEAAGDTFDSIEEIILSSGNDRFFGDAEDNRILGAFGNDFMRGGDGDDRLEGNDGEDRIEGGAGADVLRGGAGDDQLRYTQSDAGVTVDLSTDTVSGGHADGDTINSFDNVVGSDFDDVITGKSGRNVLDGGDGDDTLDGGANSDILTGGAGADTIIGGSGTADQAAYRNSDEAVTVNLTTNVNTGGHAQGDSLSGIENIRGSDFNDILTGDANKNLLRGDAGNDTLNGEGGNDILSGGENGDTLNGGDGFDRADYRTSDAGVNVDLLTNTHSGGDAAGDNLISIEGVLGSDFSDMLLGNNENNKMRGFDGDDFIQTDGGVNTMEGGAGTDTFAFLQSAATGGSTRILDFTAGETIELNTFGYANAAAANAFLTDDGTNITFSDQGVTIIIENASLADVQSAITVNGLAETPPTDGGKSETFVFEDIETQTAPEMPIELLLADSLNDAPAIAIEPLIIEHDAAAHDMFGFDTITLSDEAWHIA